MSLSMLGQKKKLGVDNFIVWEDIYVNIQKCMDKVARQIRVVFPLSHYLKSISLALITVTLVLLNMLSYP